MNTNVSATAAPAVPVTTDKLKDDLRMLAADMEQLLRATASQTGERVARARANAEVSLRAAQVRVADLQDAALARTREAGRATDAFVRANPWQVVAIGAATGLLLGLMLGRRGDGDC
jgi:ElaB/YqjD/DUF883 family membrane-anchored ribosome-binding protein